MTGPASTDPSTDRPFPVPLRDPRLLLEQALAAWGGQEDLWIFGYASLIWRPDFEFSESRRARVHGWHRALRMWSRVNRGTPEVPGLVFALLSGGSCHGVAYRVLREKAPDVLARMWLREMVTGVYDPRWLPCKTTAGPVRALAFTLSRRSPNYTGPMTLAQYQSIFQRASGRYGSTIDYVEATGRTLLERGIQDRTLHRLLREYGATRQTVVDSRQEEASPGPASGDDEAGTPRAGSKAAGADNSGS